MSELQSISDLSNLAKTVLAESDTDSFLQLVEQYLTNFETWRERIEAEQPFDEQSVPSEEARAELRAALEDLSDLNRRIIERASEQKDDVALQMSEVHRRASAMKKYVDRFPSRITIAGRRKG